MATISRRKAVRLPIGRHPSSGALPKSAQEAHLKKGLPAEEHKLRAEARPHRHQQTVAPRWGPMVLQGLLQHQEDRGRGEVPDLAQAPPGDIEGTWRELQGLLHGFE